MTSPVRKSPSFSRARVKQSTTSMQFNATSSNSDGQQKDRSAHRTRDQQGPSMSTNPDVRSCSSFVRSKADTDPLLSRHNLKSIIDRNRDRLVREQQRGSPKFTVSRTGTRLGSAERSHLTTANLPNEESRLASNVTDIHHTRKSTATVDSRHAVRAIPDAGKLVNSHEFSSTEVCTPLPPLRAKHKFTQDASRESCIQRDSRFDEARPLSPSNGKRSNLAAKLTDQRYEEETGATGVQLGPLQGYTTCSCHERPVDEDEVLRKVLDLDREFAALCLGNEPCQGSMKAEEGAVFTKRHATVITNEERSQTDNTDEIVTPSRVSPACHRSEYSKSGQTVRSVKDGHRPPEMTISHVKFNENSKVESKTTPERLMVRPEPADHSKSCARSTTPDSTVREGSSTATKSKCSENEERFSKPNTNHQLVKVKSSKEHTTHL